MKLNIGKLAIKLGLENENLKDNEIKAIAFAKEADEKTLIPIHRQYNDVILEKEKELLRKYFTTTLRGGGELDYVKKEQLHGAFKTNYWRGYKLRAKLDGEELPF